MAVKLNNRIYSIDGCIVFAKTSEPFGGLSNMAPGYPLFINDNIIPSSEALYQAMRYPLFPSIQHEIISHRSPVTAKMISRKYNGFTRQDWEDIKILACCPIALFCKEKKMPKTL